jgi:hypothetical protein
MTAELVRELVDERPAWVAYMAPDFTGDVVEQDEATHVIVRFDDGSMLYGVKSDAQPEAERET